MREYKTQKRESRCKSEKQCIQYPGNLGHYEETYEQWGWMKEEETQVKSAENIFNKIKEEKFPKMREKVSIKEQEAYRTENRNRRKKNPHDP